MGENLQDTIHNSPLKLQARLVISPCKEARYTDYHIQLK
jgi:hypothetical protein